MGRKAGGDGDYIRPLKRRVSVGLALFVLVVLGGDSDPRGGGSNDFAPGLGEKSAIKSFEPLPDEETIREG